MNSKTTSWNRILWVIAGIGFLVGLYGLYDRIVSGHINAAYGSYVPWGLWIAAYTMLVGVSAGAFVVAAVIFITRRKEWYAVGRIGLLVALATQAAGMLSAFLDLGHPERFWRLFFRTNVTSMMGLMSWFYTLYGIMLLVMIWLSCKDEDSQWLRYLSFLAIPFAIIFSGAEGALFGVVGARPAWESGLTPLLFLVEGGLGGIAATVLGAYVLAKLNDGIARPLIRAMLLLLIVLVIFEWADYSTGLYAGVPAKAEAIRAVLFGDYWWVFWLIHLGLGILVPLLLLALKPASKGLAALSSFLILISALAAKLNLVIPALAREELEGLQAAYTGPGLIFSYAPTFSEWMLFVWIVSLAVLVFLAGDIVLPRLQKEVK